MTRQKKIIEHHRHCCHLLDNDQLARKEKKKRKKEKEFNTKAAKQFIKPFFKTRLKLLRRKYNGQRSNVFMFIEFIHVKLMLLRWSLGVLEHSR